MALTIALSYSAETKSGTEFIGTITDATANYGGSNPARSAGAFYISGRKLNKDGTEDEALVFTSYDQEVDTSFTFTIPKDGWHEFYGMFVRDYDNAYAYSQYELAYQTDEVVYRALQATTGNAPPNATYWEVVSSPTSVIDNVGASNESPNLEYQIYNRIIYPNAKTFSGTTAAAAALECCGDCERSEDVLLYEQAGANVDALNNYDTRGQYALGEELARNSDELIADN